MSNALICIDPGHVSDFSEGTHGARISEAALNWECALLLQTALEGKGVRVILTKKTPDEIVSNRRRAEIANAARADLFLRLHADSRPQRGFAVYYPTRSGKAEDGAIGPALAVLKASRRAALPFYTAMRETLRGEFPAFGLFGDEKTAVGAKQGALTGSIYARVPVVLVEMGSLTNRRDEDFLLSKQGQAAMTRAISEGVASCLRTFEIGEAP